VASAWRSFLGGFENSDPAITPCKVSMVKGIDMEMMRSADHKKWFFQPHTKVGDPVVRAESSIRICAAHQHHNPNR